MADLRESLQSSLGSSYTLGRELGGGGMSRVFVATDTRLRREVVIKVLAPELAAGISADRFEREIRMAAGLQHPNIVPVLAAGDVDGLPYYTMPLVDGASLRERMIDVASRPIAERVEILRDVARALSYAHKHGIVHRDIKPENILLTDGAAAVTDFGIAKALAASRGNAGEPAAAEGTRAALTSLGMSLGTPAYMAPEQAAGDGVDTRADVYSWGIIAWELLAGRHPFADRKSSQQLILAQLSETPARIDTVAPDVNSALASLIARCLEKDQARRPVNGAEVLAELEAARTGPGMTIRRDRSRVPLMVGMAVAIVAVSGAAWALISGRTTKTDAQVIAVTPFRVAGADPSLQYLREGMLDLIAAKIGSGAGARAVDTRTLLAAWKRAGGNDRTDLDEPTALRMATAVGAGDLLTGDVVGTANHVTLNARIVSTDGGKVRATGTVEGSPDSLTVLVDRLCAELLSLRAGMSERSLSELTSTSLPALKQYLEGRRLYRRGDLREAAEAFTGALEKDSNFVHPAMGLAQIGRWGGSFQYFRPGANTVFRLRSKLGPLDRAIADNLVTDDYPKDPSVAHRLAAADRWVAMDPQSVEAVGHRADVMLHFGQMLGIEDSNERARDGFLRALSLDSTYVIYVPHLPYLLAEIGDTAGLRRVATIVEADTALVTMAPALRVLEANAWQDVNATNRMLASISTWDLRSLAIIGNGFVAAACSPCIDAALAEAAKRKLTPARQRGVTASHSVAALVRGQPTRAAENERRLTPGFARNLSRYAFADGDSALAYETAAAIEQRIANPAVESTWRARINDLFGLGLMAGTRADTSAIRSRIGQLQALTMRADSVDAIVQRDHSVLALEVELATLARRNDLPRHVARLDSAHVFAPAGESALAPPSAFILSRAYEQMGDNRKALAAILAMPAQWGGHDFHATQMRQAGRLAAALGEREKALEYYRWYLAYRTNPEPSLRAERDEIKRTVAQLESKNR